MQNYDKAYELARLIKDSDEYKQYCAAKEKAFEQEMNRDLYKQYRALSMTVNAAIMAGQEIDEESKQKFQQLTGLLALSPDVNEFMLAEHRLNTMMGDIFKILTDAIDLELDFLQD